MECPAMSDRSEMDSLGERLQKDVVHGERRPSTSVKRWAKEYIINLVTPNDRE